MEHMMNILAGDAHPPSPPDSVARTPAEPRRLPDHLTEILIDNALDAGRDVRTGRTQRSDGWTPERIRIFLDVLSRCGVVAAAARAAGMSPKSAYALRNSAKGAAFARAWHAAIAFARRRPEGWLVRRLHGRCIVPIIRKGQLWGIIDRPDNREAMRTLKQLDRAVDRWPLDEATLWSVEDSWEALVEAACAHPSPINRLHQEVRTTTGDQLDEA
jgi:hypothetical protein